MNDVIDALAVYRLTRLITKDTIFDRPRGAFDRWTLSRGHTKLYELPHCPHCVSVWVALVVVGLRRASPRLWSPTALALAYAAVTSILTDLG